MQRRGLTTAKAKAISASRTIQAVQFLAMSALTFIIFAALLKL